MSKSLSTLFAEREAARAAAKHTPWMNDLWAMLSIALSVLIMSYSFLFSVVPILLFFLLWLPVLAFKGLCILSLRGALLGFTLSGLCLASTLWSDYPAKSAYLGTAFVALVACITIAARTVRIAPLLKGIILGITITLLLSLADGRYGQDALGGSYALIGLFGSKNMLGFSAQIGLIACVAALWLPMARIRKLCWCIMPALLFAYCLYASRSGTAVLSLFAVVAAFLGVVAATAFPARIRLLAITLVLITGMAGVLLAFALDWHTVVLGNFGKDATLTGRTYLWNEGWQIATTKPWLGHGYSAFWVQGQPQAERYWYEFFIATRGGFHFHQSYIQAFVDLGALGLAAMIALVLTMALASLRLCLRAGLNAESIFLLSLSAMFFVRAWVEVDFFVGPFGMGSFLAYMILPRIHAQRRDLTTQAAPF